MKKILIVDDQIEVRELVEVTLNSGNYIILKANSGDEAIKIARKEKPNLILMDIRMRGDVDGLEATKILKNDPRTEKTRILFC